MATIAILHPAVTLGGKARFFSRDWSGSEIPASVTYFPLDEAELAAALRAGGHDAVILDGARERTPVEAFVRRVAALRPEAVFLAGGWESLEPDLDLLRRLKARLPALRVIAGGPLLTWKPELALAHDVVDVVALGEPEDPCLRLLGGDLSQNVAYRGPDGAVIQAPRVLVTDLDELPTPAWDLLPVSRYVLPFALRNPCVAYRMSRGCVHGACHFCPTNVYHPGRARYHSAARVLHDLEAVVRGHGARQVVFRDQVFTGDRGLVEAVCAGLIERKLDLVWRVTTRVDLVDADLLRLMARAGLVQISFGLETPGAETLRRVGKGTTPELARRAVGYARDAGVEVTGLFIVGLEGDGAPDAEGVADYAMRLGLDLAEFNIPQVVPGTPWHQRFAATATDPMGPHSYYLTAALPLKRLQRLQRAAYRRFYLRPRVVWQQLRRVRSWSHLVASARAAVALLDL